MTAAGYDVDLAAAIGGNLRAMGRSVTVAAPVGGSALLSAETLTLDGSIGGDAAIDAETVVFGPGAKVAGQLILSGEDAGRLVVPEAVAPADRIERRPDAAVDARPGWSGAPLTPDDAVRDGWIGVAVGFAIGVAILAALTFLVALAAPRKVERLAERLAEEPARTTWIGFLTLSALLGACVVAVLTIVGVLAVPVILLAAMVLGLLGYFVAVYGVGRAVWQRLDHLPPDTFAERAVAAGSGRWW